MVSFNFNEGGRFFAMAFNYMTLQLYVGLMIPYPWYGKYQNLMTLKPAVARWHIRYLPLHIVWRKKRR